MENNNNKKLSKTMYGLAIAGIIGALGGLYYIYNLFRSEEELSQEQKLELEELKQEVEHTNGMLTTEQAIQIMACINKKAEDILSKIKPDIDERRRAVINNEKQYEKICSELFEAKEGALQTANTIILKNFGDIDKDDLNKVLSEISPYEIEQKAFKYDKPTFYGTIPDKQKIKEIYIDYGNLLSKYMNEFHTSMDKMKLNELKQDYLIFRILVLKLKAEDEIYLKYKITENQIKYLLHEYHLLEDSHVKLVNEKISRFDEVVNNDN
jgi:hypothetical protein